MRRTALFVATVATAAIWLVGCSSETPGSATSGEDEGTELQVPDGDGPTESPDPSESTGSGGDSPAESLEPCDLLSTDDQATLSVSQGEEETIGGARSCTWQASGSHTVGTDVWDSLGLADVESKSTPEPKRIGSHEAVQYTGDLGACAIAIELDETSRVDVISVAGGDLAKACTVANQAAELVEPKLP
ncbi:DUF3558 family protein [Actinophytocola sediminis]